MGYSGKPGLRWNHLAISAAMASTASFCIYTGIGSKFFDSIFPQKKQESVKKCPTAVKFPEKLTKKLPIKIRRKLAAEEIYQKIKELECKKDMEFKGIYIVTTYFLPNSGNYKNWMSFYDEVRMEGSGIHKGGICKYTTIPKKNARPKDMPPCKGKIPRVATGEKLISNVSIAVPSRGSVHSKRNELKKQLGKKFDRSSYVFYLHGAWESTHQKKPIVKLCEKKICIKYEGDKIAHDTGGAIVYESPYSFYPNKVFKRTLKTHAQKKRFVKKFKEALEPVFERLYGSSKGPKKFSHVDIYTGRKRIGNFIDLGIRLGKPEPKKPMVLKDYDAYVASTD